MAAVEGRFCKNCGEKINNSDRFCFKCGEQQSSSTIPSNHVQTASLEQFKETKSAERSSFFRPKSTTKGGRTSTTTSLTTSVKKSKKATNMQVNINVGIMERNNDGYLRAIRGKFTNVFTNSSYEDIKKVSIEKHSNHNQNFVCRHETYVLLYPDGQEAYYLPGVFSTQAFQLDLYKEELGKPYSQINLFLCKN